MGLLNEHGECPSRLGSSAARLRVDRAGLAAIVALALVATACSGSDPASRRPRLQFLGDSITVLSTANIHARFDRRYDVDIDAYVGVTTWSMLGAAKVVAATPPDVVIVNLGTNDPSCVRRDLVCPGPYSAAQTEASWQTILANFPSSTCVIFVDLNPHVLHQTEVETLNRYLHTGFDHVVDWAAAYDPSWFTVSIDPHPNEAGRQELVRLEQEAIAGC